MLWFKIPLHIWVVCVNFAKIISHNVKKKCCSINFSFVLGWTLTSEVPKSKICQRDHQNQKNDRALNRGTSYIICPVRDTSSSVNTLLRFRFLIEYIISILEKSIPLLIGHLDRINFGVSIYSNDLQWQLFPSVRQNLCM